MFGSNASLDKLLHENGNHNKTAEEGSQEKERHSDI